MTLKTKLITSVSMFFLVVALLVVGVWAVSTAQVTMGGTISFNATNIYATITGTIEGASNAKAMMPLEYSAKTEPDATAKATWCQDLTFADATIPTIKWTITIENKSERVLYVTLNDNITSLSNATKTLTFAGTTYTSGEKEVPAKTSKVFTMSIAVADTNTSATVEYNFSFDLRDSSTDDVSYLNFSYNDTAMTATVSGVNDTSITEAYIPAKVTKEGEEYAVVGIASGTAFAGKFSSCKSLKKITIAEGVTTIGAYSLSRCSALTTIIIPNSLTSIGNGAFNYNDNLNYTIYQGAKYLGNEGNPYLVLVEYENTSITSCVMNDNCKLMSTYAFNACSQLAEISFSKNLLEIPQYAFQSCTSLQNVVVPNNVTSVNGRAFSGCTGLTQVTIGSGVNQIGSYAFENCTALTRIDVLATTPPEIYITTFTNALTENIRIYVPQDSFSAYTSAEYWKNLTIAFEVDV